MEIKTLISTCKLIIDLKKVVKEIDKENPSTLIKKGGFVMKKVILWLGFSPNFATSFTVSFLVVIVSFCLSVITVGGFSKEAFFFFVASLASVVFYRSFIDILSVKEYTFNCAKWEEEHKEKLLNEVIKGHLINWAEKCGERVDSISIGGKIYSVYRVKCGRSYRIIGVPVDEDVDGETFLRHQKLLENMATTTKKHWFIP